MTDSRISAIAREMLDARPAIPFRGDKACDVFVPITTPDVAGVHDDVRDILRKVALPEGIEIALVEVTHQGKPALGVVLPSDLGATAKAKTATAAIEKALPERAGAPLCKSMLIRRSLERWGG